MTEGNSLSGTFVTIIVRTMNFAFASILMAFKYNNIIIQFIKFNITFNKP